MRFLILLLILAINTPGPLSAQSALESDRPDLMLQEGMEVLDLTHLGPIGAGSTCPNPAGQVVEDKTPIICQENAYEKLCEGQAAPEDKIDALGPQEKEQIAQWAERAKKNVRPCLEKIAKEYKVTSLDKIDEPAYRHDAEYKALECQENAMTSEQDKKAIAEIMTEVVDAYVEVFKSSRDPFLASKAQEITSMMRECFQNPRLDAGYLVRGKDYIGHVSSQYRGLYDENASINRAVKTGREMEGKGISEIFKSCKLSLSPRMWQRCLARDPKCLSMMVHEAGHLINSCVFAEHIIETAKIPGNQDAKPHEEIEALANTFVGHTTECLEKLVDPQDALLSACTQESKLNKTMQKSADKWRKRCATIVDCLSSHPSQWFEAEADLWGSSALAFWLDKRFKKDTDRKQAYVKESIMLFCGRPRSTTKDGPRAVDPKDECYQRPADPNMKMIPQGWGDEHLPAHQRINDLWLRNDDLRQSLGCSKYPIRDSKDGLTCSPRGIIRRQLK